MRALNYWLRRSPNEKTSEKSAIKNRPFYVFCCFHPLSFSNFSTFFIIASRKEPKIIFFNIETYLQLLVEIYFDLLYRSMYYLFTSMATFVTLLFLEMLSISTIHRSENPVWFAYEIVRSGPLTAI